MCRRGEKRGDEQLNASNEALGRSRGGFSTKIHLLCDGNGHPLRAVLSPGQSHESKSLQELLDEADVCGPGDAVPLVPARLAGDKGYRYDWIDEWLLDQGITPVIPSKANEDRLERPAPFDKSSYRRRCIIECLIGWLKECRRVATRYEKLALHYLSMIHLAMIGRYLRVIAPENSRLQDFSDRA